jgi:hypothetical protein
MLEFVRSRIVAVLRSPDGWGPPHAVELQLQLLIEMWHVATGANPQTVRGVTRRFARYLGRERPGAPVPLCERLGLTEAASPEFVRLLWGFVREEQRLGGDQAIQRLVVAPPALDPPRRHAPAEA